MNHLYEPQSERQITNLLSPQDVGFIAGVVQGTDRTNANAAAIDSGFFWSTKKRRPNLSLDAFEKEQRNHEERTKESAKLGREALAEREKGLGSSKGAKVRHGEKRKHIDRFITRGRRLKPRNKTFSTIGVNADSDLLNHTATSGGDWVG